MPSSWLKRALPWALYDWANSAFATTVMAGFVPVFNKDFWSADAPETVSSFRLGMANSLASVIVALLAPALGAIADQGGAKKRFLFSFAALGMVMTGALHFVARGQWGAALALYALAGIGFAGANVFYDSLLVSVASEDKLDVVSALGYALGYIGGGLLFALNVWMVRRPETFGFAGASEAVRFAFLTVAAWWAIFALPLFFFVPEPKRDGPARGAWPAVRSGFGQLRDTFRAVRQLRMVLLFLLGYWLYIDGVDTVIRMATDYGRSLKFPSESLITALLITQFVGFPSALVFGKLGEKLGAKTGIFIALAVYVGVCLWGCRMQQVKEFYALAIAVGLVQGGVQALSRSFYARLIPPDKAAEFFGFYNMLGRFAAVLGPAIMGFVGLKSGNPRAAIVAIIPLFLLGGLLLAFVKPPSQKARTIQPPAV
jgi:UMF1 family MFS transporter